MMRVLRWTWLAALLLITGCRNEGPDKELVFYIDPLMFTPDEVAILRVSADRWEAFTHGHVKIDFTDEPGQVRIIRGSIDGPFAAQTLKGPCIRFDLDQPVAGFAMHEMGHAIGLEHTTRGIMKQVDPDQNFSEEDRAECRRVGLCD